MGCRASKPAVETVAPSSTTSKSSAIAKKAPAANKDKAAPVTKKEKTTASVLVLRSSKVKQQSQQQSQSKSKQSSPRSSNNKQHDLQKHHHNEAAENTNTDPSLYRVLLQAYDITTKESSSEQQQVLVRHLTSITTTTSSTRRFAVSRPQASYRDKATGQTPLHLVGRLLDHVCVMMNSSPTTTDDDIDEPTPATSAKLQLKTIINNPAAHPLIQILQQLLRVHPAATVLQDAHGHRPLHYAVIPFASLQGHAATTNYAATIDSSGVTQDWALRTTAVQMLLAADTHGASEYLQRNNVVYNDNGNNTAASSSSSSACSPLYRILQLLPDDFESHAIPTVHAETKTSKHAKQQLPPLTAVDYVALLRTACNDVNINNYMATITICNASNGDQPLALLYRRFTRQFDQAETFFDGDNSRDEVLQHRLAYKTAAGNTWKLIELLLSPMQQQQQDDKEPWRLVHRAVQLQTPPDLLRYLVETNAQDLTVKDQYGNLPLHYAAKSRPPKALLKAQQKKGVDNNDDDDDDSRKYVPAFYTKYVVDELLYKFPEAATVPDADGNYPLTCAVVSGKQWIGGGIKSLYEAFPDALQQIDLKEHAILRRALFGDMMLATTPTSQDDVDDMTVNESSVLSDGNDSMREEKKLDQLVNDATVAAASSPLNKKMIRDQPYDAIMLVQQPNVNATEVVTSMWAHEDDAGVQMLSCVAISRLVQAAISTFAAAKGDVTSAICASDEVLRIALSAAAGVVNAMKAHPNEVIVQEKAAHALRLMARTDGRNEISFVASGAVSALVGAMQAHVSDDGVQEEACAALAEIIRYGGADRATVVASVSGVTAIINAIAAHPDVAGVQKYGCMALKALTDFPSANLPELPRSQSEPLLLAAKRNFPQECTAAVDVVLARLS